ncbi:MAG: TldD/PmbA family protein [Candidatus Thorarchaeota archaeon]
MTEDALSVIQPLIQTAEKEGADEVELYALSRSEKTVNFQTSSLKSASGSRVQGVGIRVLVDKSLGFASANSFDKGRIIEALQDAVSIAKTTPSMDHYFLSKPQKIKSVKDLYSKDTANLSMTGAIEYGKTLLKHISEIDSRLSVESGFLTSRVDEHAITTSTGIESTEMKTALSWQVLGWAVDGEDIGSFDFEVGSVVSDKDMNLEAVAKMFADKVLQNLGANRSDSFKGTAIFSPEAAYDLVDMLITSAKATAVQSGSSFLQDKLGESIAIPDLTITDDGSTPNIPSSSSFDREGVPHKPTKILDAGVLKGFLYNTFTANKDGLSSTGHASGGFRSAPDIGATHTEIHKGKISFEKMLSEVDQGIYIQRVSMDPDYTSGDFSAVMKGGQLIENGERKMTLKEMTVTGNLFDALKNITGISKEQKSWRTPDVSWLLPYLRIENLDFAS